MAVPAAPFLRWAGGKRQLLPQILPLLPTGLSPGARYIEPFLGGGAVFFATWKRWNGAAVLADANEALIGTYKAVRDRPGLLVDALAYHVGARKGQEEAHYYKERANFNQKTPYADRFLYLNRTCFNGMYRVNKKGEFNVPYGHLKNPTICDAPLIHACSTALEGVTMRAASFEETLRDVRPGDLIYADPPYVPRSLTASFDTYTAGGFDDAKHSLLAAMLVQAMEGGTTVVLSQSESEYTRHLYAPFLKHPDVHVKVVQARRNINSKGNKRGPVGELLAGNWKE